MKKKIVISLVLAISFLFLGFQMVSAAPESLPVTDSAISNSTNTPSVANNENDITCGQNSADTDFCGGNRSMMNESSSSDNFIGNMMRGSNNYHNFGENNNNYGHMGFMVLICSLFFIFLIGGIASFAKYLFKK